MLKITEIVGTIEGIGKTQISEKSGEILTVFLEKWPFFTKSVIFSKLVFLCFLPGFLDPDAEILQDCRHSHSLQSYRGDF